MRLTDLDGHFVCNVSTRGHRWTNSDSLSGAQGVQFQCPTCGNSMERREENGRRFISGSHYIMVLFANPRNAPIAPPDAGPSSRDGTHPRWTIDGGTSIHDLTVSPSINCDIPWKDAAGVEHQSSCKFHGYIKQGDAA